jgi:hypothetical protein
MRLRSDIFVRAYIRRCFGADASAAVVRHGDDEAGTIYIKVVARDGSAHLYGPAPPGELAEDRERRFALALPTGTSAADIDAHLERQARFDPDLWLIEVEDRLGAHHLDGWLVVRARPDDRL